MTTSQPQMIRVLLVDDEPLFRTGLRQLLGMLPRFEVVAEGASAEEGIERMSGDVDLVVTDLRMGALSGIDLTRLFKVQYAETPVLMLSSLDESLHAEQALDAGASGYVMKSEVATQLAPALEAAIEGRIWLSEAMWARLQPAPVRPEHLDALAGIDPDLVDLLAAVPRSEVSLARALSTGPFDVQQRLSRLCHAVGLHSPLQLRLWVHQAAMGTS